MKIKFSLLFFALFCAGMLSAQDVDSATTTDAAPTADTTKAATKTKPLTKADYRRLMTEANYLFLEENYPRALRTYKEAYQIDSSTANINYKIGVCYVHSGSDKKVAIPYLEKAVKDVTKSYNEYDPTEKKAPVTAHKYLAEAYHLAYEFDKAIEHLETLQELAGHKKGITEEIEEVKAITNTAKELTDIPNNVEIVNLGDSINTPYPEYSPVISVDESMIIFTSRREGSTGGFKTVDDQFYEDIYVSYKGPNGAWLSPVSIGDSINTTLNEATIGLSPDGQQLFIYRSDNGGDIYYSVLEGLEWTRPQPMGSNINTPSWETHASISADGNTLYFTSDREGGMGGRDIYRCVRLPNGEWSLALNLGPSINTEKDEDSPFIHPDGVTLIFSSEGHNTMGGFDIFYSRRTPDDQNNDVWTMPMNMGHPINTTDDDIFYTLSADGRRAYYSSVKDEGKGEKDLYIIKLTDIITSAVTLLKGKILVNGKDDQLPDNLKITAVDVETGVVVANVKPNARTNEYVLILTPGENGKVYTVTYEADEYQPIVETIEIQPGSEYQEIERGLDLRSINFEKKEKNTVALRGTILNTERKAILAAKMEVKDNETGELIDTYYSHSVDGSYYFLLNKGVNYNISYEADGYLFQSENIDYPKDNQYSEIEKDVILSRPEEGKKIVLNNIFFDTDKDRLKKQSVIELEKLHQIMLDFPDMKVEVGGHTDAQGNDNYNLRLSDRRAKQVVNYLVQKGVDKKRLVAKGYGETVPVASNDTEEGRAQNRRVELKIIESK